MNRLNFYVLLLLASTIGWGQETTEDANHTKAKILKLEQQVVDASLRGDSRFFQSVLRDDYLSVSALTGRLTTKQDALINYRSGNVKFESLQPSELQVRLYGNAALVTGAVALTGKVGNRDFSGNYRFSHIFVRHRGRWQIAYFQSTSIPQ